MRQSDSVPVQGRLAPGAIVGGKYTVDEFVGAGGMGAIYKATHTAINRTVAIKMLRPFHSEDPFAVKRFDREARAAGTIGHDNICEVIDVGTSEDGSPFLVMPWLNGSSLAELIGSEPLSIQRIADITCQTLSALQVAHDAQIVHRDLKPENIFITKMGDRDDFVKLLDFGISKIIDQKAAAEITQTGTVLGTSYYMAPEQAMGIKEIDHRIDIYAVGVILYELLTGRRPFTGDSYNEVVFKIVSTPFELPSRLNPTITGEVERIVIKAMARDPLKRYESADQMRRAIEAAVPVGHTKSEPGGAAAVDVAKPVSTSIDPAGVRSGKRPFASRSKIALAIGALLLFLIAMALWGNDRKNGEKENDRPASSPVAAKPAVESSVVEKPNASIRGAVEEKAEPPEVRTPKVDASPQRKKVEEKMEAEPAAPKRMSGRAAKKKGTVKGRTGTTFFGQYDE